MRNELLKQLKEIERQITQLEDFKKEIYLRLEEL